MFPNIPSLCARTPDPPPRCPLNTSHHTSHCTHDNVTFTLHHITCACTLPPQVGPTTFTGYSELRGASRVLEVLVDGKVVEQAGPGTHALLLLDRSPFYAESGGQVCGGEQAGGGGGGGLGLAAGEGGEGAGWGLGM